MRIAQIVPQVVAGGAERVAADLAMALTARGHEVELFWANSSDEDTRLAPAGVQTRDARAGRMRIPLLPHRLVRVVGRFHADILHAHSGVWYPSSVAATVSRTPLVFTDHGRYPDESRWSLLLQRWCAKVTDEIVAVSAPLATFLREQLRLPNLPRVVDNGIDVTPFRTRCPGRRAALRAEWGVDPDDVVIVMSGRLVEVKNHAGLLEAMAAAGSARLKAVFVGTGPLEEALRARTEQLGLASRVRFLGYRQDIPDCLKAADVFAMPSDTEGLPIALLEALATGMPLVASAVGAIPEALGAPPAGILIPPKDTVALRDAIVRLAGDSDLRARLSTLAQERVAAYTLDRMTDRYEELYSRHAHPDKWRKKGATRRPDVGPMVPAIFSRPCSPGSRPTIARSGTSPVTPLTRGTHIPSRPPG